MEFSIYLHDYVIDILHYFGNIEDVINKMLTDLMAAGIDITNKPKPPKRDDARRITVRITNAEYLDLITIFSINSPTVSLRRLIYWFVDNGVYSDLNWAANSYNVHKDTHLDNAMNKIQSICDKSRKYTSENNETLFNELVTYIQKIKDTLYK